MQSSEWFKVVNLYCVQKCWRRNIILEGSGRFAYIKTHILKNTYYNQMKNIYMDIQVYQQSSKIFRQLHYTSSVTYYYDPQDLVYLDHAFCTCCALKCFKYSFDLLSSFISNSLCWFKFLLLTQLASSSWLSSLEQPCSFEFLSLTNLEDKKSPNFRN